MLRVFIMSGYWIFQMPFLPHLRCDMNFFFNLLICLSLVYYNKMPQTEQLVNRNLFFTILEARKLRSGWYYHQVRILFQTIVFCYVFTCQKGAKEFFCASFIKAVTWFMRSQPLWPNHLTQPPHPRALGFQHLNFGGTQTFRP